MKIFNGDCLEEMKNLPDKSVDLFICDLPYGETKCGWDTVIDMEAFWVQFKRLRKSKRTACIHFCSTKFGYSLIKSWEKGFKLDLVWKKRNKTGGLASRFRPMRNHEMVYFFYEQAPKYNRDKYHKRINNVKHAKSETTQEKKSDAIENTKIERKAANFEPPNPDSVIMDGYYKDQDGNETNVFSAGAWKGQPHKWDAMKVPFGPKWNPALPVSVQEEEEFIKPSEDEPLTMFESGKVFIGKRNHQTEKPQDILEFFLKYWSDEGDVILDPTMGSGSTGVACKKLGREFIGFELTEKYFEVAKNRLA